MATTDFPPCIQRFLQRPLRLLEISIQKELAVYLNAPSPLGKDWRDVSERCGFSVLEMKVRDVIGGVIGLLAAHAL